MAKRVFIDTSAWVAIFNAQDKHHKSVSQALDNLTEQGALLITSDYIIDETVTTILTRSNHANACSFLDQFDGLPVATIPVFPVYFGPAQRLFRRYGDKGFSFTDCASFVYMQAHEVHTALTLDKHFAQMGFAVLP